MPHPFLICQQSEYDTLRKRASQSPWKDFVNEAHKILDSRSYDPSQDVSRRATYVRDIMGSAALLYIVEPENQNEHRKTITDILDQWSQFAKDVADRWDAGGNRWGATVPPSSAFFNTVLALDVIHDDLSETDLQNYEQALANMADWFWAEMRGWAMATYGPRALWAAYKNEDRLKDAMQQYRDGVFEQMTKHGVGVNGPEYSHARLNGERTAKYGFMHVAEYTGLDKSFYRDYRLKWYYEWLFSAGCSPFHSFPTFSDSGHGRGFNSFYPQSGAWAAHKFSPLAAEYASHRVSGAKPRFPSDLLVYCIAEPLPEPRIPQSHLWPDGGALFYEHTDSDDALMGALWNVSAPSHSHRDANAIYLAGYGEHLLLNSGYNGYGNDSKGFPWSYINNTAESSNTLLINHQNHLEKGADGITEGLIADGLDYACGLADRAFEDDTQHLRSFIFIHPQNGVPGYYLLIDEVENSTDPISIALHPASANVETVRESEHYTWNVRSRKETDTYLTTYFATEPQSVELKDGVLAGWGKCFVGKYLYTTYANTPIATVLFPHNPEHPCAKLARTNNATLIEHANNITDTLCLSGEQLTGRACLFRHINNEHAFYFARLATHFHDNNIGFDADDPITLFMRGNTGHVVSPGTTISFHHPNITGVQIDGESFISETAENSVRVTVPQGTCKIEFI